MEKFDNNTNQIEKISNLALLRKYIELLESLPPEDLKNTFGIDEEKRKSILQSASGNADWTTILREHGVNGSLRDLAISELNSENSEAA